MVPYHVIQDEQWRTCNWRGCGKEIGNKTALTCVDAWKGREVGDKGTLRMGENAWKEILK